MIVRQRAPPVSEFIAREPAAQRACRPGGIQCYANWRVCRNPAIAAIECAIAAEFSGAWGVRLAATVARASTIYEKRADGRIPHGVSRHQQNASRSHGLGAWVKAQHAPLREMIARHNFRVRAQRGTRPAAGSRGQGIRTRYTQTRHGCYETRLRKYFTVLAFIGVVAALAGSTWKALQFHQRLKALENPQWERTLAAEHVYQHPVVAFGDSEISGWPMAKSFGVLPIINRGVAGDEVLSSRERFAQQVLPLNPAVVVILTGTNDLAHGQPPAAIIAAIRDLASS